MIAVKAADRQVIDVPRIDLTPGEDGCLPASGYGDVGRQHDALRNVCRMLARRYGPGLLAGITLGDWVRLVRDSGFAIDIPCLPRAAVISAVSVVNSIFAAAERLRFGAPSPKSPAQQPLFVLGHWRSGTTHLYNLLACDDRMIAPTLYQVLFPHTFRSTERLFSSFFSALFAGRRGFDNVRFAFDLPGEDEYAISILCGCSPYLSQAFPRCLTQYRRFLTFHDASPSEVRRWQGTLKDFVAKYTSDSGRIPLLKSPPHTCRIRLLLELFPRAKFIHVHRHPFAVFRSRRAHLMQIHARHQLQRPNAEDLDEGIIAVYREMHASFFRERAMIPEGNYHEIEYEALAHDPLGQLHMSYEALSLGPFERTEVAVRQYLASLGPYERNDHSELSPTIGNRLVREWRQSFEEWKYRP